MTSSRAIRWGGLALMLGALIFMLTKLRHLIDPDDSMLGIFIYVGFLLWLVGLVAVYARYRARAGRLGRTGLIANVVGIALLSVGHAVSFASGTDLFIFVIFGTIGLVLGALLFGIAALRTEVLPRWRALPLATGLIGLAWIFLSSGETSRPRFMVFRTLFALGWLLLGYVLWSDRDATAERPLAMPRPGVALDKVYEQT